MLANGGEVFRAQDTMEIMARSFGIVDFHVYVLTNGIFASAQNGTVSAVRHVPAVSTNLGHVEAINAISRRVADGELDLNSAQLEFERMKRMPTLSPLYNCAAATMGLTPGVALTMGIRDIINSDYLSGTIRLVDALLVAGCLAVGVTLGYTLLSTVTGVVW